MQTLFPYPWQLPLIDKITRSLTANRFIINGCPTGSGKTILALEAAKRLGGPLLCLVPRVSVTQWTRTAEAMGCRNVIDIVTAQSLVLAKDCPWYTKAKPKKGQPAIGQWTVPKGLTLVWDEPHKSASGENSQSTCAMAALRAYGARLHLMSATIADTPRKLRAAGYWARLHAYNDASFFAWCRKHGCEFETQNGRRVLAFTRDPVLGRGHMEDIRREFGEMFISIKAEDIPGFPEMTLDVQLVDLDARDRAEVSRLFADMSERMKTRGRSELAERGRELERIEYLMAPALAELTIASVSEGNSAVVGFHHTEPRIRFEAELAKAGILNVSSVYGMQKDSDRQAGQDLFQANVNHVMSVMVQAGGASLNLHDEHKVRPRESFFIPGDNASDVKQFLGRIRRCNGTFARQHLCLAAGTLQERVAGSLNRKLSNIDTINDSDLMV